MATAAKAAPKCVYQQADLPGEPPLIIEPQPANATPAIDDHPGEREPLELLPLGVTGHAVARHERERDRRCRDDREQRDQRREWLAAAEIGSDAERIVQARGDVEWPGLGQDDHAHHQHHEPRKPGEPCPARGLRPARREDEEDRGTRMRPLGWRGVWPNRRTRPAGPRGRFPWAANANTRAARTSSAHSRRRRSPTTGPRRSPGDA